MKIGVFVIATGKYGVFIPGLIESSAGKLFPGHKVFWHLLVDGVPPAPSRPYLTTFEETPEIVAHRIKHRGWPGATLYRYHDILSAISDYAPSKRYDHLYTMDVDMKFVGTVGDEAIGRTVAVLHPGFFNKPRREFTYEGMTLSMAYMRPEEGTNYYAGGFQGGEAEATIRSWKIMAAWIDADQKKGITPLWHDESIRNKYLWAMDRPDVILPPSYCWPEKAPHDCPKILALDKNHKEMRL